MSRRVPVRRIALRASLALGLTVGGGGLLLSAGDPSPAVAASGLKSGCTAPSPKAKGAGSAAAAVKRVVRGVSTNVAKEPRLRSPSSRPPRKLVSDDAVRCGKGERVSRGDTIEVRYKLVVWGGENATVDSSWDRKPTSSTFRLAKGELIDGWVQGIPGMRVGGRRVLVVPPSKGYGSTGTPDGGVPPNGTLIFVIDVVGVS